MPQTASQILSLNVAAAAALTITTAALPDAVEFQPYSQQLAVSGGTAPYHWTIKSGALPAGLTLSDTGLLSGTPTASSAPGAPFAFEVAVTDSGA